MRTGSQTLAVLVGFAAATLGLAFAEAADTVPAFPGAEGFGAQTPGGRGGRVIEVTNLNDSGPGSFRAACEAEGRRIVVFRVGGTIELKSGIAIAKPFITIAGQTAPGGGITLKNGRGNKGGPLAVRTHDVIIRYLRLRPGPGGLSRAEAAKLYDKAKALREQLQKKLGKKKWSAERRQLYRLGATCCLDGLSVTGRGVYNVVADHLSVSWAVDEVVEVYQGAHDVTFQWCVISEGLIESIHYKGTHSMGPIFGGPGTTRVSLHHNLMAHNNWRNPRIQGGTLDIVNNVTYNTGGWPDAWKGRFGKLEINAVGNYWIPGPSTAARFSAFSFGGPKGSGIYVKGNLSPQRAKDDLPEELIVRENQRRLIVGRFDMPPVKVTSAVEAYKQVLAHAGCTVPWRDAVDERIISDVKNRTGKHIRHPEEVGGWPKLAAGTPPTDTDHDGMPDTWETSRGLNPNDANDGSKDRDGDGYTNVEEYINGLVPDVNRSPAGKTAGPHGSRGVALR